MGAFFQKKKGIYDIIRSNFTANYHLKEIFESHELEENRTIRKIRTVQNEGNRRVSRELAFYSLDAIIAVRYRVNSKKDYENEVERNVRRNNVFCTWYNNR